MLGFQAISEAAISSLAEQSGNEIDGIAIFNADAYLKFLAGKLKTGDANILSTGELEVAGQRLRGSYAFIESEATFEAKGGAIRYGVIDIEGNAYLITEGGINGSGWVRVAPNTPEWKYLQSSKWNKIN
jgi:hypothetical protein